VSATLYTTDGTNITWEAYSANSANVFSTKTLIATGTLTTPASSYVARTFSFTASSAVSNGLEIRFKFGALLSGKQGAIGAVQLEKGTAASPFEYRLYGTELALCQRYFTSATFGATRYGRDTAAGRGSVVWVDFPVEMRAAPSTTQVTAGGVGPQTITPTTRSLSVSAGSNGGDMAVLSSYTASAEL
jgi:hypothetical protein